MKRTLLGLSVLGAIAAAGALAQDGARRAEPFGEGAGWRGEHRRFSAEDRAALAEARIAALRAGLKLTPEQDKLWPPVEEAIRGLARQRGEAGQAMRERFSTMRDGDGRDVPDLLRSMAERQAASAEAVRKLADGLAPLYASLDEGQKRRLTMLSRGLMRGTGQRQRWFEDERGGRGERL